MKEFKSEVNGIKTLKDLGMQYATVSSKHKVRMAYFECPICKVAFKSIYYRPAHHCHTCRNILTKTRVNEKFSISNGTKFNKLTVLQEVEPLKTEKGSRKRYFVKCSCGKEFITTGTGLKRGRITECSSCAYQKRPQSSQLLSQEERMFTKTVVNSCKQRNITNSLTSSDYITLVTQNCHYCGTPPNNLATRLTRHNEQPIAVHGLDRIDSAEGYHLWNVVPCCTICNIMKNTLSVSKFIQHIESIYKHYFITKDLNGNYSSSTSNYTN